MGCAYQDMPGGRICFNYPYRGKSPAAPGLFRHLLIIVDDRTDSGRVAPHFSPRHIADLYPELLVGFLFRVIEDIYFNKLLCLSIAEGYHICDGFIVDAHGGVYVIRIEGDRCLAVAAIGADQLQGDRNPVFHDIDG